MAALILLLLMAVMPGSSSAQSAVQFAVIGDYGKAGTGEKAVADMVKSWNPDFIVTVGDNNYNTGSQKTIDANIGQYYHDYIGSYTGQYGPGSEVNRFFPVLGNHDWDTPGAQPYLDYFTLPGNERYYDFVSGPVHFFMLDGDFNEPDGLQKTSLQAEWLKNGLAAATEPWKLVVTHLPPYSSGMHGSQKVMRWPFREWGATAVLAGHDHTYERLEVDGFPYFVNGLGGAAMYRFVNVLPWSEARYNHNYGAMRIKAMDTSLTFEFYSIADNGTLVDSYTISR
jgi:hypothetical protein